MVGAFRDDDKGFNSGSVYVFERDDAGFFQVAKRAVAEANG